MILQSPWPTVNIPESNFGRYMLHFASRHGTSIALIDAETRRQITFKEFCNYVMKCSSSFVNSGLLKGDVIALCCSNIIEYPIILIAAACCGLAVVPCNPSHTADELERQMELTKPKMVIGDDAIWSKLSQLRDKVTSIKNVLCIESNSFCQSLTEYIRRGKTEDFPGKIELNVKNDPFILASSSGTTGLPKAVNLSQFIMTAITKVTDEPLNMSPEDLLYLVLPMFHAFAMMSMFAALFKGCTQVISKRFAADNLFRAFEKYNITLFYCVPPMLISLNEHPKLTSYYTSRLRHVISAGAPLAESISLEIMQKMKTTVSQMWGLTEVCPVSMTTRECPVKSVGHLCANTSLKVLDLDTRKELGPNQSGELWLKGPQVILGYYKNPSANAECFDEDGWFRSGDIGYYDEKGNIFLIDRLKEIVKYKAFQVAPAELEGVLLSHPLIRDVAVVGIPDFEAGELPKAFVVRKSTTLTAEEIHTFLEGKVAKYKYLRGGVEFCDVIPKTGSGKILRRALKARGKL
ncbi:uncharacterized protein LOC143451885 isoform X1 [Clavelina lepadiformis]|uniref:uncharacterized protein LOC143451885 isoform X1 n=2 Tax=Clavelina lepadiformis TaxID=159417 RepID=UPI004041EC77